MSDPQVPDGFLRLSDAVNRLASGMWGGLPRPVPVQTIKQTARKLSLGFGPWRQQAARCFRAAALEGAPVVYAVGADTRASSNIRSLTRERALRKIEPVVVPAKVLGRLLSSRGGLPDHPIRPTIKTADGNETLFALLDGGLLVVRKSEFVAWYRSERRKGKWASQRSISRIGSGRPTKQIESLRNAVLAFVHDGAWNAKDSIARLHRLLVGSGRSHVPSPDTLARLLNQMHLETGEPELFRIGRKRRKRSIGAVG